MRNTLVLPSKNFRSRIDVFFHIEFVSPSCWKSWENVGNAGFQRSSEIAVHIAEFTRGSKMVPKGEAG